MLAELETLNDTCGLVISKAKTQIMVSDEFKTQNPRDNVTIGDYEIVETYKYLGTKVTFNLSTMAQDISLKADSMCRM